MSIKLLDDGHYMVDIRPRGSDGKRIRRKFSRKSEAKAFELHTLANIGKREEWQGKKTDRRALSELIENWWNIHGVTLDTGVIERRHLIKTMKLLGDVPVHTLTKKSLLLHRTARLRQGISASTINRDLYRLSGMFTTLIKLEEFQGENPASGLPPLKQDQPDVVYLEHSEIADLLSATKGDEHLITLLCLSTGARWSEADKLTSSQVTMRRVRYLNTKNGKNRIIPISAELQDLLKAKGPGKLFKVDYEKYCDLLREVKPDLPRGQATHVLRHTFASHFMMNGGNIITLRDILGHASIEQTMVYAHFAPDFLQHAVTLNPLKGGISCPHSVHK